MSDFACGILRKTVQAVATGKARAANKEGLMCPYKRNVPKYTELQK